MNESIQHSGMTAGGQPVAAGLAVTRIAVHKV